MFVWGEPWPSEAIAEEGVKGAKRDDGGGKQGRGSPKPDKTRFKRRRTYVSRDGRDVPCGGGAVARPYSRVTLWPIRLSYISPKCSAVTSTS